MSGGILNQLDASAYERLVRSVVDYAIYMIDPKGRVATWNSGAEHIKGYSAEEIIGEHFSRFYTEEDCAAGAPQRALRIAATEGRFITEAWRVRRDGSRFWAVVAIDAVRDDHGEIIGFAKVTRDISDQREARIALERSQQALVQAQKMEAVGQLTGGLAHDFNNLLTGIIGGLDLLSLRLSEGRLAEVGRYVAAAQGAAERAATLTHRLLAFSRQQTLEPKVVDANRLVRGMEDLIARSVGPGVEVGTDAAPDLWLSFCDPNQLENAILNLCINARDAMPGGGRMVIETRNVHDAGDAEGEPGVYVVVAVRDTGCGIAPSLMDRVFDPFYTTKPIGKGSGLGLSMIYGFAKQSGGRVRIESEVDVGTKVSILLPRHLGGSAADTDETAAEAAPRRSLRKARVGRTVLVVDDEPMVRMLVAETLKELGYETIEASDAAAGLKVLASGIPVDLLITDIGMPGMSGRQLAERARAARPELKVLFMTGYAANATLNDIVPSPATQVLAKPFPVEKLAGMIRTLIGDR